MASGSRRLLGWGIDYLVVMVPGVTIVALAMGYLVKGLPGFVGGVAGDVGWGYLVKLIINNSTRIALGAAASSEWVVFALPLIVALLTVPLFQFTYTATFLAWRGRTFGKKILGTRVAGFKSQRMTGGRAMRRAFLTTAVESGGVCVALAFIVIGHYQIGILVWAGTVVAFWLNVLPALAGRRRTIIDRVSGTMVVRRGFDIEPVQHSVAIAPSGQSVAIAASAQVANVATLALPVGPPAVLDPAVATFAALSAEMPEAEMPEASPDPATAGRTAADAARAAGRATVDAAAVAGQLAREGADAVIRSAPVQKAMSSRAGQQAQALGSAGAEQARKLGGHAAERARSLGGRAQEMWRQRQANRADTPPPVDDQSASDADATP